MMNKQAPSQSVAMLLMDRDFRRATIRKDKFTIEQFRKDYGDPASGMPEPVKEMAEHVYIAAWMEEFNRDYQRSVEGAEDSFIARLFDMIAAVLRSDIQFIDVNLDEDGNPT